MAQFTATQKEQMIKDIDKTILNLLRQPESNGSKIGAVEIDADGVLTRIKEVCTKPNCSCEGVWWHEVERPHGKTTVIYRSDVETTAKS